MTFHKVRLCQLLILSFVFMVVGCTTPVIRVYGGPARDLKEIAVLLAYPGIRIWKIDKKMLRGGDISLTYSAYDEYHLLPGTHDITCSYSSSDGQTYVYSEGTVNVSGHFSEGYVYLLDPQLNDVTVAIAGRSFKTGRSDRWAPLVVPVGTIEEFVSEYSQNPSYWLGFWPGEHWRFYLEGVSSRSVADKGDMTNRNISGRSRSFLSQEAKLQKAFKLFGMPQSQGGTASDMETVIKMVEAVNGALKRGVRWSRAVKQIAVQYPQAEFLTLKTTKQPDWCDVKVILGEADNVETGHVTISQTNALHQCSSVQGKIPVHWYKYGWCHFAVWKEKTIEIRADCNAIRQN